MFDVGDVVRFFSPTAGKEKFHLCLGQSEEGALFAFLHLNSKAGYRGECILDDGQIPGLPKSPTTKTVISFSVIVRMGELRLKKFGATKTGAIDSRLAGELAAFAKTVRTLNNPDKVLVVKAFESLLP